MRRSLLRALVLVVTLAAVWSAFALVGGTPGALYAVGVILLASVLFVRLKARRDDQAPLPARPWNRKARRIQELEGQLAEAVTELAARARTIEELRARVEQQAADQRVLQTTLQTQLAALAARLRSHESELASFEQQLEGAPRVVDPTQPWSVRA